MMRVALVLVAVTACAEDHVALGPMSPALSPEQRVAAFTQLEPRAQRIFTLSNNGVPVSQTRTLILADGQEIAYPEDLLPVVQDDSETARAARRSASARHSARWARFGYLASSVALGAAVTFGLDSDDSRVRDVSLAVGAAAIVGLVATYFIRVHYAGVAHEARDRAFAAYPQDLGVRLDVCAHGLQIVPCAGYDAMLDSRRGP